jgi:pimeloyl-ACP methyl ester carboxylesterase
LKSNIHTAALVLGLALFTGCALAAGPTVSSTIDASAVRVKNRTAVVRGVKIFYREAGSSDKPTLLLLHGFPSSSHMYRELLRLLARDFHLVAPDYPGAGFSDYPSADKFVPSFANLADLMSAFVEQIGLSRYTIYMQDFGGPVGFRMAVMHPDKVSGLIIQNANAYLEGIAPEQLNNIMNPERPQADQLVTRAFTLFNYKTGARDFESMDPTGWHLDAWILEDPDVKRIQTALLMDYHSNVAEYPRWQSHLRAVQPKTLILWGRNDPIFLPAGAQAYRRDLPKAKLQFYDTGHFALEEDAPAIARAIQKAFALKQDGGRQHRAR